MFQMANGTPAENHLCNSISFHRSTKGVVDNNNKPSLTQTSFANQNPQHKEHHIHKSSTENQETLCHSVGGGVVNNIAGNCSSEKPLVMVADNMASCPLLSTNHPDGNFTKCDSDDLSGFDTSRNTIDHYPGDFPTNLVNSSKWNQQPAQQQINVIDQSVDSTRDVRL